MQFNYTIRTKQGEVQSGVIEAANRNAAIDLLLSRGFIILKLDNERGPMIARDLAIFNRVKQKDLVSFSRQLATLVSAQVPLLTSLQTLARQTESKYFREILLEVANDVEGGTIFSSALQRHPKAFSNFFVNMTKAGEASGSLEASLNNLADYLEKQFYLNSKIKGAMTYPGFIMGAFTVIVILMMAFVFPKLTSFIQESGGEMPIMTRVVIAISNFFRAFWWLIFMVLAGGGTYFFYSLKKSKAFRRKWDQFLVQMPMFGKKIFQKIYVARIADNLSTLISGGLSILQSLQVTSEVVGNTLYQEILEQAKEEVKGGSTLSSSFMKHEQIPALVSQMIATGEQTGSLDLILKRMGQFYSKELDATVDNLSQLIEPVLIVIIGAGVAVLISSILMPIYNIANTL